MGSLSRAFTILIVEDYALIALEVEDAVRRNGGRVLGPVATVAHAIRLLDTVQCDAALLDIKLMHGETTCSVAERLQARRIPFAFVTGWDGDIGPRFAQTPVLRKPFGEAELDACLRALMGGVPAPVGAREAA